MNGEFQARTTVAVPIRSATKIPMPHLRFNDNRTPGIESITADYSMLHQITSLDLINNEQNGIYCKARNHPIPEELQADSKRNTHSSKIICPLQAVPDCTGSTSITGTRQHQECHEIIRGKALFLSKKDSQKPGISKNSSSKCFDRDKQLSNSTEKKSLPEFPADSMCHATTLASDIKENMLIRTLGEKKQKETPHEKFCDGNERFGLQNVGEASHLTKLKLQSVRDKLNTSSIISPSSNGTDGILISEVTTQNERFFLDGKSGDNIVRRIFPVRKYVVGKEKNHRAGATNVRYVLYEVHEPVTDVVDHAQVAPDNDPHRNTSNDGLTELMGALETSTNIVAQAPDTINCMEGQTLASCTDKAPEPVECTIDYGLKNQHIGVGVSTKRSGCSVSAAKNAFDLSNTIDRHTACTLGNVNNQQTLPQSSTVNNAQYARNAPNLQTYHSGFISKNTANDLKGADVDSKLRNVLNQQDRLAWQSLCNKNKMNIQNQSSDLDTSTKFINSLKTYDNLARLSGYTNTNNTQAVASIPKFDMCGKQDLCEQSDANVDESTVLKKSKNNLRDVDPFCEENQIHSDKKGFSQQEVNDASPLCIPTKQKNDVHFSHQTNADDGQKLRGFLENLQRNTIMNLLANQMSIHSNLPRNFCRHNGIITNLLHEESSSKIPSNISTEQNNHVQFSNQTNTSDGKKMIGSLQNLQGSGFKTLRSNQNPMHGKSLVELKTDGDKSSGLINDESSSKNMSNMPTDQNSCIQFSNQMNVAHELKLEGFLGNFQGMTAETGHALNVLDNNQKSIQSKLPNKLGTDGDKINSLLNDKWSSKILNNICIEQNNRIQANAVHEQKLKELLKKLQGRPTDQNSGIKLSNPTNTAHEPKLKGLLDNLQGITVQTGHALKVLKNNQSKPPNKLGVDSDTSNSLVNDEWSSRNMNKICADQINRMHANAVQEQKLKGFLENLQGKTAEVGYALKFLKNKQKTIHSKVPHKLGIDGDMNTSSSLVGKESSFKNLSNIQAGKKLVMGINGKVCTDSKGNLKGGISNGNNNISNHLREEKKIYTCKRKDRSTVPSDDISAKCKRGQIAERNTAETQPSIRRKRGRPPGQQKLGMPKRPLSAYNYFFRDQRKAILGINDAEKCDIPEVEATDGSCESLHNGQEEVKKDDLSDARIEARIQNRHIESQKIRRVRKRSPHRKIAFGHLGKVIAARWKAISPEEHTKYQSSSSEDGRRYKKELAVFKTLETQRRRREIFTEYRMK